MKYNLFDVVLSNSSAKEFSVARNEWCVSSCVDCGDNPEKWEQCICGKDGIRYCYEIKNRITGEVLYPIGSECIKKFDREDMNLAMKRLTTITDFNTSMREVIKKRMSGEQQIISSAWLRKPEIIGHLYKLGILTRYDFDFLDNTKRKRVFTHKQSIYETRIRMKVSKFFTDEVLARIGGEAK